MALYSNVVARTPAGSTIIWQNGPPSDPPTGDRPADIIELTVARMRDLNKEAPARELSLAITHCEEAGHWLRQLDGRRP